MRTCNKCGCYLPDNWTTCPACFTDENQIEEKIDLQQDIFHVDVLYKNNTKSSEFFAFYDNAIKFAHRMACQADVAIVLVIDFRSGKIIEKLSRKGY